MHHRPTVCQLLLRVPARLAGIARQRPSFFPATGALRTAFRPGHVGASASLLFHAAGPA